MAATFQNLSVIIPAYNEEARIEETLQRILEHLRYHFDPFEVIVVDDGSTDATCEVVHKIALQDPRVRVLKNPANRGKGYSIRRAILESSHDWLLMTDADLSTPIEELEKLASFSDRHDVIIGSRGLRESRILVHQPRYREAMGRMYNLMVQAAALPGIRDSQCGFKLFRAAAAKDIFSRATIDGFGFDVEVLFIAKKLEYSICEVPIVWINNEMTRVRPVRDSLRMALDLLRIRARHRDR